MRYRGDALEDAVRATFTSALEDRGGWGGLIGVDREGRTVLAHTSDAMFCGYLDRGEPVTRV
jgi:isoaspartyl peptidase/L-asparaginase-like protein (Ntn-hydrolase superfamily)